MKRPFEHPDLPIEGGQSREVKRFIENVSLILTMGEECLPGTETGTIEISGGSVVIKCNIAGPNVKGKFYEKQLIVTVNKMPTESNLMNPLLANLGCEAIALVRTFRLKNGNGQNGLRGEDALLIEGFVPGKPDLMASACLLENNQLVQAASFCQNWKISTSAFLADLTVLLSAVRRAMMIKIRAINERGIK